MTERNEGVSRIITKQFCFAQKKVELKGKITRKQVKRFITIILLYLYAFCSHSPSFLSAHLTEAKEKIIIKQKHTATKTKTKKNYSSFFFVCKLYNFIVEIYELLVVSGLSNHWVGKESDMNLCRKFCGNLCVTGFFMISRVNTLYASPKSFWQTQLLFMQLLKWISHNFLFVFSKCST